MAWWRRWCGTRRSLSVAKGLEAGSLARMSEVLAAELPMDPGRIAALSGPNPAPEVAWGCPPGRWWSA
ncbi:MAG: hypothetical protein R3C32_06095 [Chloroflexota bacterium]